MTSILMIASVFWPFLAGILGYGIGRHDKKLRDLMVNLFLILEGIMAAVLAMQAALGLRIETSVPEICGTGLFFRLDGFRGLFVMLTAFLWMMSTLLAVEYMHHERNRNRYYLFLLLTEGATMGVFLSANLFTTFIFFEIMSFTSYVWVAQNETKESLSAALTYLAIAVIGGLVMLMGLFLLQDTLGTLQMSALFEAAHAAGAEVAGKLFLAGVLVLVGFGAKAAMFPLHVWMPRAHTVAPAPASALLSGILTKAGLFGILVISGSLFFHNKEWGNLILILGLITMTLGAVLAVFAVNLKRTLACSSMSQMGFVLVGIGMASLLGEEGGLAVRGAVLHMMNHSLFKLILFLSAGVVFMNLEELELNDVRGFGRGKRLLQAVFLSGALGIGGVPLFSGYASKTLLHESILEYVHEAGSLAGYYKAAELLFLFCGGLTVSYMIKLYVALFVNRHPKRQEEFDRRNSNYVNPVSRLALILSGVTVPVLGVAPGKLMEGIANMSQDFFRAEAPHHGVHYFAWENLKGGLISIVIGILVYTFFIRRIVMVEEEKGCFCYVDRWPSWLDLEKRVYEPLVRMILPEILGRICRFFDGIADRVLVILPEILGRICQFFDWMADRVLVMTVIVKALPAGAGFLLSLLDKLPDFFFMLLREFVFRPLRLLTAEQEAEKIRRHRERGNIQDFARWSTMTLSFGFLTSCAGILIMLVWVFTTLLH